MLKTSRKRFCWWRCAAACAALVVVWAAAGASVAAETAALPATLQLVPDDAAFYGCRLHNREQVEAVVSSRAWAKLKALQAVQMGLALYNFQAANPQSIPGKILAAMQDPELKETLSLVGDMMSDEVFCYGDRNVGDLLEFIQRLNTAQSFGPAVIMLSEKGQGVPPAQLKARALLSAAAENLQLLKVPDVIFGFKVSDTTRAKRQLDRWKKRASEALEANPLLKGRLKKTEIAGHSYLVLSLDGQLVPWDELPLDQVKEIETNQGDADKVIQKLKKMTLVVAVGLRDDFLLLSIGSSTDALARLGQGKHLADRPEIAPLGKFADKRLTAVGYVSKAMATQLASNQNNIDGILKAFKDLLPMTELPSEEREKIGHDAAALVADLKTLMPEPGAMSGVSFLNGHGIESYHYSWGSHPGLDGSKPLSLLEHIGGTPTIAAVARGKVSMQNYDLAAKWLGIGYGYIEKYAVPKMQEGEREKFQQFAKAARPLVTRLHRTTRDMLLPALADGQCALVVDTKLKSKRFFPGLPAADKPLPMLEPALVLGVSDAELLRKACVEYRTIFNGLIDAARNIEGSQVPENFRIPEPTVLSRDAGTLYTYPLPKEWGVNKIIVPNAGLSSSVAVLSINAAHTQRLLAATPPSVRGRSIPTDRPLAAAGVVDIAGLIDALTPWIDLAFKTYVEQLDDEDSKEKAAGQAAMYLDQVHTFLDVLKVFRTLSSQSYTEGGAMVNHVEFEIHDFGD